MRLHQWIERGSFALTVGLLGLIVYEQSALVARVSKNHLRTAAKSFAPAPPSVLVPVPSRRPRAAPRSPVEPEPRLRNGAVRSPRERVADNAAGEVSAPLTTHVSIVPDSVDGVPVGVRFYGIRPNSLLALIGLENGDRLESINGHPLATPEQALEAYAYLRTATRLQLAIERRGKPLVITYLIV